ncbi:glycerophosphodiester phosphodiesterase family protein [Methylothermus subterraneus]
MEVSPTLQYALLGPRPFFLLDTLRDSSLKDQLTRCARRRRFYRKSEFVIGHRGAALMFPEHSKESYLAAARMGAGILECDVTFTKDKHLVCRHSQCDLHTTTNLLETPLAEKCRVPFQPAEFDAQGNLIRPATALCCTSDLTLEEFKSLKAKMDGFNPRARTVAEYLQGTPSWRTDLYGYGTVLSHKESIALFKKLKVKMTPELKAPEVPMPFAGLSQEAYAQKLIDEYKEAGVPPEHVFPQSFNLSDVLYWIEHEPEFGRQAVFLDGRYEDPSFRHDDPATWRPSMEELARLGVKILAPPLWMLLSLEGGEIVPSIYARRAKAAGLRLFAWTLERSDLRQGGVGQWYYQTVGEAVRSPGDLYLVLDALARRASVSAIFTDWPATAAFYANCMGL